MPDLDLSGYAIDGLTPGRVYTPATVDELSSALAEAQDEKLAAIPVGGGARTGIGNVPERYDAAIDLNGLSSNIEHAPGDLTLVAEAGVRLDRLQELLSDSGQRLPFDIAHPQLTTVGGALAANPVSLTSVSLGGIRDWLLGMRVTLADGTQTKSGGRVVKNVQGYDLHRLHTGALGTLGVVTEAAFKLTPVPDASRTVAAWFSSTVGASEASNMILSGPALPEAIAILSGPAASRGSDVFAGAGAGGQDGQASALLLVRLSGVRAAVIRQVDLATGAAGAAAADGYEVAGADEAERLWPLARGESFDRNGVTARITVKPADAARVLEDVELRGAAGGREAPSCAALAGYGVVTVNWPAGDVEDARKAIIYASSLRDRFGGSVFIEGCPTAVKPGIDVFGPIGPSLEIMRRLKREFDPAGTLSPGRFAGRI